MKTLQEVKSEVLQHVKYTGARYKYKTSLGWTLVQNGEVLCENVRYCC